MLEKNLKKLLEQHRLIKFERSLEENSFTAEVEKEKLLEVVKILKDKLSFEHLSCLWVIDQLSHFEVNYHFYSYTKKYHLFLKTEVNREDPELPSLIFIWRTADFQEREAFDLFGVKFEGHPNLKRILLAEDFPGHPLRKDYPMVNDEKYLLKDKDKGVLYG